MTVISVKAVPGGWAVQGGAGTAQLVFLRGGEAERKAHQLGAQWAEVSGEAEVRIHDRTGALVGRSLYVASQLATAEAGSSVLPTFRRSPGLRRATQPAGLTSGRPA